MIINNPRQLPEVKEKIDYAQGELVLAERTQTISENVGGLIGTMYHFFGHMQIGTINGALRKEPSGFSVARRFFDEDISPNLFVSANYVIPVLRCLSFEHCLLENTASVIVSRKILKDANNQPLPVELNAGRHNLELFVGNEEVGKFLRERVHPSGAGERLYEMMLDPNGIEKRVAALEKELGERLYISLASSVTEMCVARREILGVRAAVLSSQARRNYDEFGEPFVSYGYAEHAVRTYKDARKRFLDATEQVRSILGKEEIGLINLQTISFEDFGVPVSVNGEDYVRYVQNFVRDTSQMIEEIDGHSRYKEKR